MGGRGSAGIAQSTITPEDWEAWSEDPSVLQRLERGQDMTDYFRDQYDEDEWKSVYKDMLNLAQNMGSRAESETIDTSTLYRGERFKSLEEAQKKFTIGNTITTSQLTSYSKDLDMARAYANMYGGNSVAVVITNTSTNGRFTALQTNHPGYTKSTDPEVLVKRGFESKVTKTRYDKNTNTLYVTMTNSVKPKRRR